MLCACVCVPRAPCAVRRSPDHSRQLRLSFRKRMDFWSKYRNSELLLLLR